MLLAGGAFFFGEVVCLVLDGNHLTTISGSQTYDADSNGVADISGFLWEALCLGAAAGGEEGGGEAEPDEAEGAGLGDDLGHVDGLAGGELTDPSRRAAVGVTG